METEEHSLHEGDAPLEPGGCLRIERAEPLNQHAAVTLAAQPLVPRANARRNYNLRVTSQGEAEYERVGTKYAPARLRDILIFAFAIGCWRCLASSARSAGHSPWVHHWLRALGVHQVAAATQRS